MCGRYRLRDPERAIQEFADESGVGLGPVYNVAPTRQMPVVVAPRALARMSWGFVPFFSRSDPKAFGLINARVETVEEKPSFRQAFRERRCVVLADGFYEWRKDAAGGKEPFFIGLRDEAVFGFAGIYEPSAKPGINGYCVLTTAPNSLMRPIHERMPVILDRESASRWLAPGPLDRAAVDSFRQPYPAERMVAWRVSPLVNNARNEGEECCRPVGV